MKLFYKKIKIKKLYRTILAIISNQALREKYIKVDQRIQLKTDFIFKLYLSKKNKSLSL